MGWNQRREVVLMMRRHKGSRENSMSLKRTSNERILKIKKTKFLLSMLSE